MLELIPSLLVPNLVQISDIVPWSSRNRMMRPHLRRHWYDLILLLLIRFTGIAQTFLQETLLLDQELVVSSQVVLDIGL